MESRKLNLLDAPSDTIASSPICLRENRKVRKGEVELGRNFWNRYPQEDEMSKLPQNETNVRR